MKKPNGAENGMDSGDSVSCLIRVEKTSLRVAACYLLVCTSSDVATCPTKS